MAQTWLVGGAVRDALLGLPVHERDWVVVGSTPQALRAAGYRQVGRDFPVFLHPRTGEEYALARTERKSGHGYHGFTVHAGPEVSLAADLQRRDLTINAIAQADDGRLYDPWGGQADLAARRLRHVSPAFREDPLRVLRVARFAARLAPLGFTVAAETRALMEQMVVEGELDHLTPERVWRETARALAEPEPVRYFDELTACGALAVVLPELDRHWRDTGYGRPALRLAADDAAAADIGVRLAAACHELSPDQELPALRTRLPMPKQPYALVTTAARLWPRVAVAASTDADALWEIVRAADGLRRPAAFDRLLAVWAAASRARGQPWAPLAAALGRVRSAASEIEGRELAEAGWTGANLARELERRRLERVRSRLAGGGSDALRGSQ